MREETHLRVIGRENPYLIPVPWSVVCAFVGNAIDSGPGTYVLPLPAENSRGVGPNVVIRDENPNGGAR